MKNNSFLFIHFTAYISFQAQRPPGLLATTQGDILWAT
jgi:hypothetical protein